MIVFRTTDRISVKVGGMTVKVAPLSYSQKTNVLSMERMEGGRANADNALVAFQTLKCAIREVEGFPEANYPDGSKVELKWENGELTSESLEVLIQVIGFTKASQISTSIFLGDFNKDLDGVVFESVKPEQEKKA